MRRICTLNAVLTLALAASACSAADAPLANHYGAAIVPRNLFRLRTPEIEKSAEPPRHVRAVKLVGLTSIPGGSVAILRVRALATTEAREMSLMLKAGAEAEGVRVLQISISAGTIRLNVDGEERLLDIRKDAPAASAVGNTVMVPSVPPGTIPASRL